MNDIEILDEMLIHDVKVSLQSEQGRHSAELSDLVSGSTVKIKGIPKKSIIIRAESFQEPVNIFNGIKGERKRADFVIVSNDTNGGKWIICIETQEMDSKLASHVIQQLKGSYCFINYCKCIGQTFWNSDHFLNDYEYRFVSIVDLNFNVSRRRTEPYNSKGVLHNNPRFFLKISQCPNIYFRKLIDFIP